MDKFFDVAKQSFGRIVAINFVAVLGVIAGIALGVLVDWKVGLLVGLGIVAAALLYGLVFVNRTARKSVTIVSDFVNKVQSDIEKNEAKPLFVNESGEARYGGALPPMPQFGLPPDIARQYGVPQHPSPREFFGKQYGQQPPSNS